MTEKTYLRWYNKIGYGSGDIAGNVAYAFLAFFVMIYLTDTMGMNAGIVGTLMMLSKVFDGFSDFIFGILMDKTNTRMGKARPWMFWAYVGCATTIVAVFAIPPSLGDTAKYAWFFIAYTLLNGVFFTANNIAYGALTALITKNKNERVQMGSIRFVFAFGTSLAIQASTVGLVQALGGDASAWRTVAIIYALIGVVANSLSVFSVRELPPSELADETSGHIDTEVPIREALRLLATNKYYVIIVITYIMMQLFNAINGMGIYFMTYVLGDPALLGTFAWAFNIPQMVGLIVLPFVVARAGEMYKVNMWGYIIAIGARVGIIIGGYMMNVPVMLIFTAVSTLAIAPLQGTLTALIAETSENTYLRSGKRLDGMMFSCTSLGTKLGGGIGTAMTGWMLSAAGYISSTGSETVTQPESVITMLNFAYLWLPLIIFIIIAVLIYFLDVEKANERISAGLPPREQAKN